MTSAFTYYHVYCTYYHLYYFLLSPLLLPLLLLPTITLLSPLLFPTITSTVTTSSITYYHLYYTYYHLTITSTISYYHLYYYLISPYYHLYYHLLSPYFKRHKHKFGDMHSFKTVSKTERLHFLAVSITQMPPNYSNVPKLLKYLKTTQMSHNYTKAPKLIKCLKSPRTDTFSPFYILSELVTHPSSPCSIHQSPMTSHRTQTHLLSQPQFLLSLSQREHLVLDCVPQAAHTTRVCHCRCTVQHNGLRFVLVNTHSTSPSTGTQPLFLQG